MLVKEEMSRGRNGGIGTMIGKVKFRVKATRDES